jgi:predicted nucleic acid-binding protein
VDRALQHVEAWLESPSLVLLAEEPSYFSTFKETALRGMVAGGMVHDARIAALCIFHGVTTLYTSDRDFSRFPTLKTANPLV